MAYWQGIAAAEQKTDAAETALKDALPEECKSAHAQSVKQHHPMGHQ